MKKILVLLFFLFFLSNASNSYAVYDPTSISNNKFGIHILFPSEVSDAAKLVNSTGGDWGYVTIPIQANDKNLVKWQSFMDDCRKNHIIPIIRIATLVDYFNKDSWKKPTDYDILDFANFLNDLNWPTKNRYVIIYNEVNRGDEWGGTPNAAEYAEILDYASDIFKKRSEDFFVISAGLDNASANTNFSVENYTFMRQMNDFDPGIFAKIDGLASHSYPNPAFAMPPSTLREGIYSYYYQQQLALILSGKKLPIFITETGWSSKKVSQEQQAQYYIKTFANYWNDPDIIAVTPFIYNATQGDFSQFSFVNNSEKNKIYYAYFNISKVKGNPEINPENTQSSTFNTILPTEKFKSSTLNSIFQKIGSKQKEFFKWILGI